MSVLCYNDNGWVIDHQEIVRQWYKNCKITKSSLPSSSSLTSDTNSLKAKLNTDNMSKAENREMSNCERLTTALQLKNDLFAIKSPYMMDSQFIKLQKTLETDYIPSTTSRKRKKKVDKIDEDCSDYTVIKRLSDAHKSLISLAQGKGYLLNKYENIDNNKSARQASQIVGPGDSLIDIVETSSTDDNIKPPLVIEHAQDEVTIQINQLVHFNCILPTVTQILGEKYLLPVNCRFLLSDWSKLLQTDITNGNRFDLIVIDPPWKNKSVKRKKSYNTVWEDTLLDLPIYQLINNGGLVVIWVTNKPKLHSFIKETLLPSWKLKFCAEWHWLKVTTSGELICDINTTMKKPYETLIIAQYINNKDNCRPSLLNQQVIISIPCSLHSKKPPLLEIMKPFLVENPKCLELFARNLQPHWTSWGNEVLKHQHLDYYEAT
ncbi:N(6)-adenine-specific methyltransferase METTL4 isoform X1 [Patella vulgata]|uniref:N(6)-adenine-specific methyltransferase METTL4 isoform X1 n=1 Tax=Patella vulgata TaxID=6465 RepID=UPI0024A9222D|nr:N(6)-adenine-specific methyltransferase METTL4 isoform X1 [Patella vulgata]